MRLIIFVNKLDENDDLLGFFTGWLDDLSRHASNIIVITQFLGSYNKPENVEIKLIAKNINRLTRLWLFWRLLWSCRNSYETFFSFMAPAWVVAAWPVTILNHKRIALWYAVWKGTFKLRLANLLADRIITSVPEAFPLPSHKVITVGQGIDTDVFNFQKKSERAEILFLGRISPVKRLEVIFQALSALINKRPDLNTKLKLNIVGGPAQISDISYEHWLVQLASTLKIKEHLNWLGRIPHTQVQYLYQRYLFFVNMTPTGSFDKTMLEAMASGCIVLASNQALVPFFDEELRRYCVFSEGDSTMLAQRLATLFDLSPAELENIRIKQREIVSTHHSRSKLAERLAGALKAIS